MVDPEPRYVLTFRPGTAEAFFVGLFKVLGAAFAVYVSEVLRFVDCANEAWSECSDAGLVQKALAYAGLAPAAATLVASRRTHGHPWRWFGVSALVYAAWGFVVLVEFSG